MRIKLILTLAALVATTPLFSQGCSDAGICTINNFKPDLSDSSDKKKNKIKVGMSYGKADNSITVFGSYFEFNKALSDRVGLDIKATSLAQNGNNIDVWGLSDIYLNGHYKFGKSIRATLGVKIPLADGNRSLDGLPLPMDYQASLGTLDLIGGIGVSLGKLHLVGAFQQPLKQNKNSFLIGSYPSNSPIRSFLSTNQFERAGDVLLRASYPVSIGEKFKFTPSVLPIYHLADDSYVDGTGANQTISGSQGLTLNGNLYLDYALTSNSALQFNAGMPFIVRESRPDGLTRSLVVNLEYGVRF